MASEAAIEKFAEAHDLAFQKQAKLPSQGETLTSAEPDEIGAGASGELPGGAEGTLAHFDYTTTSDGTTYHHEMTVVVTRVPEAIGFAPYLSFTGGDSDLCTDFMGTREYDLRDDPGLDGTEVHVFRGTDEGWLRELFSPALQDWLARSADDFGFEFSGGVLCVARNEHLYDQSDLETLCADAAHIAGVIRAEAIEDATTGGAVASGAKTPASDGEAQMMENALAAIELDGPPAHVREAIPAFSRLISHNPPTWGYLAFMSLIFTLLANIPLIVIPILTLSDGLWGLFFVLESAIFAVVLFFTARIHIRGNSERYAAEAFFRGYCEERDLELVDPLVYAAQHAEADLPFEPERVLSGPQAGLTGEPALILRGDGSKRVDGIAIVAGPRGPVASAELNASPRGISATDLDTYAERLADELP